MTPLEVLLGYYPQISYKDSHDPQSKLCSADKNATTPYDLMQGLKIKLGESHKLRISYHNKQVKKLLYQFGESVLSSAKHIKTNENLQLKFEYLDSIHIVKVVENQAERLNLIAK